MTSLITINIFISHILIHAKTNYFFVAKNGEICPKLGKSAMIDPGLITISDVFNYKRF